MGLLFLHFTELVVKDEAQDQDCARCEQVDELCVINHRLGIELPLLYTFPQSADVQVHKIVQYR